MLKKSSLKKTNSMGLFVFNVLLLVVFIVSIAWGGFAKTGSGITIPNTGLIIPFVIFILFSIVQLIAIKCNKYWMALGLEIIKFVLFQLAMYVICGYALNDRYIQANKVGSFYDNRSYTIMVIIFMCVGCLSFIYEALFNILLSIRSGRTALH